MTFSIRYFNKCFMFNTLNIIEWYETIFTYIYIFYSIIPRGLMEGEELQ